MLPADLPFASLPAPGPHPATAELRAYAAGTLPPADEHHIEAHALDCERCAELLEGFSMSDAATTDEALAGLRARLRTRVANDLAEPLLLPASRPLWPRLAAAVALLGAVGAGIWSWQQQPAPALATSAPRAAAAPAEAIPPAQPGLVARANSAQNSTIQPTTEPILVAPAATPAARGAAGYAAVRPTNRRGAVFALRRPSPAADIIVADRNADAPAANNPGSPEYSATAAASPPPSPAAASPIALEPAAVVMAKESEAKAVATAPTMAKKASRVAATDSGSAPQLASVGGFREKAKVAESAALVRVADSPMPTVPTIAPAPVAGTPALRSYLHQEAAKFEPAAGERHLNGSVRLRFLVRADGRLSNLQVVRSMRADYDEEALRLVCEGPAWRPGIANGRRADLPMEITISF